MYLARELTGESLPAIGRQFGGRDHTTVLHACRRAASRIAADDSSRRGCGEAVSSSWTASHVPTHRHSPTATPERLPTDLSTTRHTSTIAHHSNHTDQPTPHVHSPYYILSSSKVSSVKLSLSTAELLGATADRHPRRLDPQRRAGAVRRDDLRPGRLHARAAGDRHGDRPARTARRRRSSSPGTAVLPARLFSTWSRSLPADRLTLELRTAEQDVELISGPATFHLRTLRAEDFPTLPDPSPETRIALPAEAFVADVSRVATLGLARRDPPGADRAS